MRTHTATDVIVADRQSAWHGRAARRNGARVARLARDGSEGPHGEEQRGTALIASGLTRTVKGGARSILDDDSSPFRRERWSPSQGTADRASRPCSTCSAGDRPAEWGTVKLEDVDLYADIDRFRTRLGYVPQDDIIHRDPRR